MITYKEILIKENFNEQYTVNIISDLKAIDVHITSKVRLRYDFTVLNIVEKKYIEIRLIQLENTLLEANSPMVKEVAEVSQVFGKMYSELNLKLDHSGKILEVLNYDIILSKWLETKKAMQEAMQSNDDLSQAISLNDEIYTNPEKVKKAIQANEFFRIYFGEIFDRYLPVWDQIIEGTNIFNTANMQWKINIDTSAYLPKQYQYVDVTLEAKPVKMPPSEGFYNAAYHQFAQKIDISKLRTKLEQKELRKIEISTGRLAEALIIKNEIADENNLYTKMRYEVRSDSFNTRKPNLE